jgi:glutamyl-Q tRNA(Asp) synthetase
MRPTSRFAPSTTGPAHPGTLLAALLCWLDARVRGARIILRLEDLDPERCKPAFAEAMMNDLTWLGLTFDVVEWQSHQYIRHAAAMDILAEKKLLYPSIVSRRDIEVFGRRAPDGGWAYDNRERGTPLPIGGWRTCTEPIRVQLPDLEYAPLDDSGLDLRQTPTIAFGDPVVRRRDGAFAYHLVAVVDDAASAVTQVVRGRDIAPSTATQVALQQLLGLSTPHYRHHFLLLEQRERKLAKLHGSIGLPVLRQYYDAPTLCGWLAFVAGLVPEGTKCLPTELVKTFSWDLVRMNDVLVHWNGQSLVVAND